MPIPLKIQSVKSLLLPVLYIGSGYLALLIGYWRAGKTENFLDLKGTDTLVLTFLLGSFILLSVTITLPTPDTITLGTFPIFLSWSLMLSLITGTIVWFFVR